MMLFLAFRLLVFRYKRCPVQLTKFSLNTRLSEEQKPTRCHLLFDCTSYRLNMFPAHLLCPSSGARDYNVDYQIGRFVLGLL